MRGLIAPNGIQVSQVIVGKSFVWLSRTRRFSWRRPAFLPPSPHEPVPPSSAVSHAHSNSWRWRPRQWRWPRRERRRRSLCVSPPPEAALPTSAHKQNLRDPCPVASPRSKRKFHNSPHFPKVITELYLTRSEMVRQGCSV